MLFSFSLVDRHAPRARVMIMSKRLILFLFLVVRVIAAPLLRPVLRRLRVPGQDLQGAARRRPGSQDQTKGRPLHLLGWVGAKLAS